MISSLAVQIARRLINSYVFVNVCLVGPGLLRWMNGGINFLIVIWVNWLSQAVGLPSHSLEQHSCMRTGPGSGPAIPIPPAYTNSSRPCVIPEPDLILV